MPGTGSGSGLIEGPYNEVSLLITKTSISIGEFENVIIHSLDRSDLSNEGIGRSESAIERGSNILDLFIDSVTYKQIHSVVACI